MAVWRSDSHTNVRRWFSHQVKIYSSSMHQEDTTGLIRDPDGKAYLAFRGEDVWTFQFLGIEGDTLVFSSKRPKTYRSEPSLEILSQFEQLATGDSQAITRFARKYGALGLCRHGRPVGLPMHRCQWPPSPPSVWREPLKSWQVYAKRVRAILLLVSDAYGNTSAAQETVASTESRVDERKKRYTNTWREGEATEENLSRTRNSHMAPSVRHDASYGVGRSVSFLPFTQ